jgi:hypothetical protein
MSVVAIGLAVGTAMNASCLYILLTDFLGRHFGFEAFIGFEY